MLPAILIASTYSMRSRKVRMRSVLGLRAAFVTALLNPEARRKLMVHPWVVGPELPLRWNIPVSSALAARERRSCSSWPSRSPTRQAHSLPLA
jgi:hypothetical protein